MLRTDYRYVAIEPARSGVFVIKYNKPSTGNSLHATLIAETVEVMKWANQQPDIHVIVLTGMGKFFCTGMELVEGNEKLMSFARGSDFHQLNRLFILSEKILVAAVNGPAVGYGVTSLALFDLVYSVPDAYFFTPFVKWGMTTEACSSVTFPRLMGHQKAALLCLAGERIDAAEASALGLVSKVLPKDGFLDAVLAIATGIAGSSPGSLKTTKMLLRKNVVQELLDANDVECDAFENERIPSGDLQKAMEQFAREQKEKQKGKAKL